MLRYGIRFVEVQFQINLKHFDLANVKNERLKIDYRPAPERQIEERKEAKKKKKNTQTRRDCIQMTTAKDLTEEKRIKNQQLTVIDV